MNLKRHALLAALLIVAAASAGLAAQDTGQQTGQPESVHPDSVRPATTPPASAHPLPGRTAPTTYTYPEPTTASPGCNGASCEDQQPHIVVTLPAPAPTPWPVHERIAWAAGLVLAIVGYIAVMLGLSLLRKIERQTVAAESAAAAAADAAQAALLHAQALVHAERPWITIGVEPTPGVENSFDVIASNRGRSPATITATLHQVIFAEDEAHLPPAPPQWKESSPAAPFEPIILLPGEFISIKAVKREDAKTLAGSEEKFKSIEAWTERLFLCGKVLYSDLMAPAGREAHETHWCCWYIHGRQKSGLALAGPPAYRTHT